MRLARVSSALLGAAFLLVLAAVPAAASTIYLSQYSSDETDPADLLATVDFAITGATELTITFTNSSSYNVNELYFNGSSAVTGLSLVSVDVGGNDETASWGGAGAVGSGSADGFGAYDFSLTNGTGLNNPSVIMPSEVGTFVFTISGTGPFTMSDFIQLSTVPPGDTPALVAAKFVSGPGDDSAYGATSDEGFVPAPEPASAALLALGLLGLAAARRRSR